MGRDFENRKHSILKRSARDAKAFTRAGRQISMAVKSGGGDPAGNPALRRAIQNARAVNMPKDKIQNAIDKALGSGQGEDFQEIVYEAYGPHGVALMVVAATDNPTRTVANVRAILKKGGGNLGSTGSVAFLFDQFGTIAIEPEGVDRDSLELELIDFGLERLEDDTTDEGKPVLMLYCSREQFGALQGALEERKLTVVSSGFKWVPKSPTKLPDEQVQDVADLFDRLEEDDDVQEVFCTLERAQD